MTALFNFVDKAIWPDRPRRIVTRYGLAVALPLASVAITHALFPLDRSPFSPLLILSIVCAAMFGGIQVGVVATATSLLLNFLTLQPAASLRISDPKDLVKGFFFVISGVLVSFIAGSVGALNRKVAIERRRLEVTLSCIGDAVISTDLNGCILFINPAAEEATGWSSAEACGRNSEEVFRIVNRDTGVSVESPIRKALTLGEEVGLAMHTVLLRRDGSQIPVSDSAAPIRDAHGKITGAVMVFRDISILQKREATWLQTQRLASVGRLAATIAHELNNPLQATSNFLFLISQGGDSAALQGYAREASHELNRAAEIAQQTLSFVRGGGERNSVSIGQLFDEVLLLNRNKIKNKKIEVVRRYSSNTILNARTGEIRQVLGNLVGNALDALEVDGKLYLRAKPAKCFGRPVVQFVVADNGAGMSKEHQARAFEPFFTTKKDVGTGLGLWVVKKIMDSEGGCVHMRSKVGEGTVARLCWPSDLDQESESIGLQMESS
jgi:PAS domain S-box-containing protein